MVKTMEKKFNLVQTECNIGVDSWVRITENFYHTTAIFKVDKPMDMDSFYKDKCSLEFISESGNTVTDKISANAKAFHNIGGQNVVLVNLVSSIKFFESVKGIFVYMSYEN